MANTASFSFDPITTTTQEGEIFTTDILMYSGSDPVISSDVLISYNPEVLTPITDGASDIQPGDFFQIIEAKILSPGKVYIYAINQSPSQSRAANGKLASVSFRARKAESTELRFDCIPFQKLTSQIIANDPDLTNIINCTTTRAHTSTVLIEAGNNVLGTSTQKSYQTWYVGLAVLFAIFAGVLYFRYKRLFRHLKTS